MTPPGTSVVRLYMSVSLDGFVVGPHDSMRVPMGDGGFRLFNWLDRRFDPGPDGQVFNEMNATRAVISGRRTYEHAGGWQGDHHDGVPIFVLTHQVDAHEQPPASVRYVSDVRECAALARAAAGSQEVMVHGAGAAQSLLQAGELDEMELHVVPVLLGGGRRLFDLPADHIELELIRHLTAPEVDPAHQVLHLRYRVRA